MAALPCAVARRRDRPGAPADRRLAPLPGGAPAGARPCRRKVGSDTDTAPPKLHVRLPRPDGRVRDAGSGRNRRLPPRFPCRRSCRRCVPPEGARGVRHTSRGRHERAALARRRFDRVRSRPERCGNSIRGHHERWLCARTEIDGCRFAFSGQGDLRDALDEGRSRRHLQAQSRGAELLARCGTLRVPTHDWFRSIQGNGPRRHPVDRVFLQGARDPHRILGNLERRVRRRATDAEDRIRTVSCQGTEPPRRERGLLRPEDVHGVAQTQRRDLAPDLGRQKLGYTDGEGVFRSFHTIDDSAGP